MLEAAQRGFTFLVPQSFGVGQTKLETPPRYLVKCPSLAHTNGDIYEEVHLGTNHNCFLVNSTYIANLAIFNSWETPLKILHDQYARGKVP